MLQSCQMDKSVWHARVRKSRPC
ncbi:hypothetical protein F383_15216 [Gossypium arboreum]|uniref:Uncharacterized protein n=1 Tax=Gossypium arboreum TaxID=29729 RepID=A0A0B0NBV8_GOSAR|nr:hypothetical protein F383_15216 [Gossypium arboreum]